MSGFLLHRASRLALALLGLSVLLFVVMRVAPDGPYQLGRMAGCDVDAPLLAQWVDALASLAFVQDDPCTAFSLVRPDVDVRRAVLEAVPDTLWLVVVALALMLGVGLALGVIGGLRQNGALDRAVLAGCAVVDSVPGFAWAALLLWWISLSLGLLPPAPVGIPADGALPALALALPFVPRFARLARDGLVAALAEDYVRAARARGLRAWRIVLRHALSRAVRPVVAAAGPSLGALLAGAAAVESVFSRVGACALAVEAAIARDYTMLSAAALALAAMLWTLYLVLDVLYALLDERVRAAK